MLGISTEKTIEDVVSDIGELKKTFLPLGAPEHSPSITSQSPGLMWHLLVFLQIFSTIYLSSPWIAHLMAVTSLGKLDCNTVTSWVPIRRLLTNVLAEDNFQIRYAGVISSVSICQPHHGLQIQN